MIGANIDAAGRLVRAALDEIPSRAAATLADYGQFAAGLVALGAATGEVVYAVRARELVTACVAEDGTVRPRVAATLCWPRRASPARMPPPTGTSRPVTPRWPTPRCRCGSSGRARTSATSPRASSLRTRPARWPSRSRTGALLRVAARLARAPRQVVVVGDDPASALLRAARRIPAEVLAIVTAAQSAQWATAGFALFEGKAPLGGRTTAYDCRDFTCRLPVTDPAELES
ncbi:hypothetical protein [Microbacterium terregens]|uniref:hypothetical protein n=1 Tax=Microbacterium terregens TaxID=69363 RepID=UPI0031DB4D51